MNGVPAAHRAVDTDSIGVLYIAFGDTYRTEVRRSIASLRKVSPGVPVAVVTDAVIDGLPDVTTVLRPAIRSLECKPTYIGVSPFKRTLFLDTDTYVVRDITLLFDLLDHFDICAQYGGTQFNGPSGLTFQARMCSGLLLFKQSQEMDDVFRNWLDLYAREKRVKAEVNLADERALTEAVATSKVRPGIVSPCVHINLNAPWVFHSPPLVLHGRVPSFEAMANDMVRNWNPANDWAPRVYLPNLRGLLPRGVRRSDPILAVALVLRRLWNEGKHRLQHAFYTR
jgi:hypothetical protein